MYLEGNVDYREGDGSHGPHVVKLPNEHLEHRPACVWAPSGSDLGGSSAGDTAAIALT